MPGATVSSSSSSSATAATPSSLNTNSNNNNNTTQTTTTLHLNGLTCGSCVNTVKRALESNTHVKSAYVKLLPQQTAVVVHHPDVTAAILIDIVESAGYDARDAATSSPFPSAAAAASKNANNATSDQLEDASDYVYHGLGAGRRVDIEFCTSCGMLLSGGCCCC